LRGNRPGRLGEQIPQSGEAECGRPTDLAPCALAGARCMIGDSLSGRPSRLTGEGAESLVLPVRSVAPRDPKA